MGMLLNQHRQRHGEPVDAKVADPSTTEGAKFEPELTKNSEMLEFPGHHVELEDPKNPNSEEHIVVDEEGDKIRAAKIHNTPQLPVEETTKSKKSK